MDNKRNISQQTAVHLQPGNFFSCLVGKLVDGGGPRVGWVSVDSIDVKSREPPGELTAPAAKR